MTAHVPILVDRLFTCPACPWRAVLTSDNRLVQTEAGDPYHDHIGQALAIRDAEDVYIRRLIERLRRQYQAPLPRSDGRHVYPCEEVKTGCCVCDHQDGYRLSLWMLKRLERHIQAEYGR